MAKKIIVGVLVVLVLILAGGFFWVRSVLAGDAVRTAIAGQISKTIGQPVTIGSIAASAYPRVTVTLGDVKMGDAGQIQVGNLVIGTDFRALLSRRIEHASLRLTGGKIALPLPPFTGLTSSTETPSSGPAPVELVSIDEIVLSDVQVTSGGRTLRGDIELIPQGTTGVEIRKVTLVADDATISATGRITDFAGPVGELSIKADTLNFDRLMAFANDFASRSGLVPATPPVEGAASGATPSAPAASAAPASSMNIVLSLDADRATMGALALEKLTGKARVTGEQVVLDPISFGVFGGKYDGALTLSLGAVPHVTVNAKLSGVDVAAATAFAGSPNQVTGRLAGTLAFQGTGADATSLTNSARGTLRMDITDGVVKNLGLVNAVVVATSMRSGSLQAATASGSKDEPFSRLGATLAIGNGAVSTNDLSFVSKDLNLSAQGVVQLAASTVDLKGKLQLSDELSKQAGHDLVRYTQDQGRVTLPATISGPSSAPSVRIDAGDMAKRAATNAAKEEAAKRIPGGLGGFLKH